MRARETQAKHGRTEHGHSEHETHVAFGVLFLQQVVDGRSGMSWSTTVAVKGVDRFAAQFVMGCLNDAGYRWALLKSDDERGER